MTSRWFADHAWIDGALTQDVLIEVVDGVVESVETEADRPADVTHLVGITMPAFVNAHSHAFHRLLRGVAHGPGDFWSWRDQMYAAAAVLDPDTYHVVARAVFAEMAQSGISCVGEFHYLHHDTGGSRYADPNVMGHALLAAAVEAGLRITLLDTAYLRGGLGDAELAPTQLRFSDGDVERWADRVRGLSGSGVARIGVAAHSVRALNPAEIGTVAGVAAGLDAPLHFHLSEQIAENQETLDVHGRSPTEVFSDAGALSVNATAIHATHVRADDIDRLAATSTGVCLCPTTERDLGDGLGPAAELAAAGVSLSLGTDGHSSIDMFAEMRGVEQGDRLRLQRRGIHSAESLLASATHNGATALGWPRHGIEPGALADFVSVQVDTVRLAGWRPTDGMGPVVLGATADDVADVVVAGEPVVVDGRHVRIDVVSELAAANGAVREALVS